MFVLLFEFLELLFELLFVLVCGLFVLLHTLDWMGVSTSGLALKWWLRCHVPFDGIWKWH